MSTWNPTAKQSEQNFVVVDVVFQNALCLMCIEHYHPKELFRGTQSNGMG